MRQKRSAFAAETYPIRAFGTVGSPAATIIYAPGAPSPSNGLFNDWAALVNFVNSQTIPIQIVFSDEFQNPVVIPAGIWTINNQTSWFGIHTGEPTVVHLADGCRILGSAGKIPIDILSDNIEVHTLATIAGSNLIPFGFTFTNSVVSIARGSQIQADGDLPMFRANAGIQLIIPLYDFATVGAGATPCFDVVAGANLIVIGFTISTLQPNTVSGAGTLALFFISPASDLSLTQPSFTGALSVLYVSQASKISYAPVSPGLWSVVPTVISEALDFIAAQTLGTTIAPPIIAGVNNDYSPAGLVDANVVRQDLSAPATLTGLAAQPGRKITIFNLSLVDALTLNHLDGGSAAANQFVCPGAVPYVVPLGGSATVQYDSASALWRVVS